MSIHVGTLQAPPPLLMLMGGADEGIPRDEIQHFEWALKGAGVEYDLHICDGAPHSFLDRKASEFQDASTDAWQKTREFIARHSR